MSRAVLVLFFCTGTTALVYEVIWSKYLALLFGSTVHAQTIVLAAFMGGLAIGNKIFGKRASGFVSPLRAYGIIEIILGLYAFLFHYIFLAGDSGFQLIGSIAVNNRPVLLALKALTSALLLLPPTILMGGTLPLLASWLEKNEPGFSRATAKFYGVNTLGAFTGAWLGGFVIVPGIGLNVGLQIVGFFNVLIGITAIIIERQLSFRVTSAKPVEEPHISLAEIPYRKAILLVVVTGAVSMGLEVLCARMLSLLFGASLHSFSLVLMGFILGIGLGSLLISARAHKLSPALPPFLLLGAAICAGLVLTNIEPLTINYLKGKSGFASNSQGYLFHQIFASLISLLVIGFPAGLIGAILPACLRMVRMPGGFSQIVGNLLTYNTLAAVIGVLLTGFLFMPLFGIRGAMLTFALVLCVAAFLTAPDTHAQKFKVASIGVAALLGITTLMTGENWRHVISAGVFRTRMAVIPDNIMDVRKRDIKILYYKDGADATVSVETDVTELQKPNPLHRQLVLRINGKPDASSRGDLATQLLLGHLPMFSRPDAKEVFVLGFGSGITGGAILSHPVNRVTIAENCKPVLEAGQHFAPWNNGILTNSRTRIAYEDARTVLKLEKQLYDVIICEPSNPWVAGVGSVFSSDFYQLAASRLTTNGLMVQWYHIYEMHDEIVLMVLRTFSLVFPFFEVWDAQNGDIILVGAQRPWSNSLQAWEKVMDRPGVKEHMASISISEPAMLLARQMTSQLNSFPIAGDGPIQEDMFPVLEYAAPKAFFIGTSSRALFAFDERTWQSPMAQAGKRQTLGSLQRSNVVNLFATVSSVNPYLLPGIVNGTNLFMPSIFKAAVPLPARMPTEETNSIGNQMIEAFLKLHAGIDPDKNFDFLAANIVKESQQPTENRDWRIAPFAAAAARHLIGAGQLEPAQRMVGMGLRFGDNSELQYLLRVIQFRQSITTNNAPAPAQASR